MFHPQFPVARLDMAMVGHAFAQADSDNDGKISLEAVARWIICVGDAYPRSIWIYIHIIIYIYICHTMYMLYYIILYILCICFPAHLTWICWYVGKTVLDQKPESDTLMVYLRAHKWGLMPSSMGTNISQQLASTSMARLRKHGWKVAKCGVLGHPNF